MRQLSVILFTAIFLLSFFTPTYSYVQISEYLCEMGIKFYQQGRYEEALQEFHKALLAQPGYTPALKYIQMIEQMGKVKEAIEERAPISFKPRVLKYKDVVIDALDLMEIQMEMIKERQLPPGQLKYLPEVTKKVPTVTLVLKEKPLPVATLHLDESLIRIAQPIEIEQGKYLIIVGSNIQRFLVTQPDIVKVQKYDSNYLSVTGQDIGYTYMHVWDENGRWTLEFLTTPPKPSGPTLEEEMRLAEEKARNFKLRYVMDWSSFESGRRLDNLERSTYSYATSLTLDGPTPYGNLDSTVTLRSLKGESEISYFTLGLEEGNLWQFKDFSLRSFDYHSGITNLAVNDVYLRGVMFKSPAFSHKIDYTTFWGRTKVGLVAANLSPGMQKTIDQFLAGAQLNFSPQAKQKYSASVFHGWGRSRSNDLNAYTYDFNAAYHLADWGLNYEIAQDSETFAHLFTASYIVPELKFTTEVRNSDKDFKAVSGYGSRPGELGILSTLFYQPYKKLNTSLRLDVYQDRRYPSIENDDRWNENLSWETNYTIDPLTSARLDYALQNNLGTIGQYRNYNAGIGFRRTFELMRKIYTFANYRHQENKNYSAHALDYINEKINLGLRFPLFGQLGYFLNKELNWLEERLNANWTRPQALETGIDWADRIFKSNFYGNMRFTYRDEEDTVSSLSFLSGEDYIEGYSELSWRPATDTELYCSSRVRNIWADNPSINKRIDVDFRAGMRYLWDTGLRWESIGAIEGYVFKDINDDGLMQRDEAPIEGVKIWLGKDKFQVTDIFGYYKFTKVKARKAYVNIDITTLPSGFVLTVPVTQEIAIVHGQSARVNFGIISRSEILGVVFEDANGNGKLDSQEFGIKGVVLVLEDGTKAVTDNLGRYYFRKAAVGKHTITLDLNSLPATYIPTVPIFKDLQLFEGVSYNFNIPLRRTQQ